MDMGQHEIIKKRPGAVGRMKTKALQGLVGPRENNSLKYLLVTNGVTALGKKTCFYIFQGTLPSLWASRALKYYI